MDSCACVYKQFLAAFLLIIKTISDLVNEGWDACELPVQVELGE